jgi:hypothetical protein
LWDVIERFDNEMKLQEELNKHLLRVGREPLTPMAAEPTDIDTASKPEADVDADANAEEPTKNEAEPASSANDS